MEKDKVVTENNPSQIKRSWLSTYLMIGFIYYLSASYRSTLVGSIVSLVVSFAAGFFYPRIKAKLKIKHELVRVVVTVLIVFTISAFSMGALTAIGSFVVKEFSTQNEKDYSKSSEFPVKKYETPVNSVPTLSLSPKDKVENDTIPNDSNYTFKTIFTSSNKTCGIGKAGDEIYTELIEPKGNFWRIKFVSEKVKSGLSNFRVLVFHTSIEDAENQGNLAKQIGLGMEELGDGKSNNNNGVRKGTFDLSGKKPFRLKILCSNSNYTLEVQDTK